MYKNFIFPVDRSIQKLESKPDYLTTEGIYRVPGDTDIFLTASFNCEHPISQL